MTLEYIPNKTRQVGNNVTVAFNFLFKVFAGKEATDLLVYKIDKTTTPETQGDPLIFGTDYQVVLSTTTEGGTVTYTTAPSSTEDAFIIREVDYKQETELKPNNKFNEVAVENSFDKDAMVNSQLLEQTERTIKVSEIYTGSADFTLPPPEASKVLGYDSTGLLMANYSGSDLDTILTTSYGQTLVQSANALGARNVLELGITDDVEFAKIEGTEITGSSFVGLPDATETIKGVAVLDKYWMWGFIPTSGSTPDTDVTITVGKALCEDGNTIVELLATETDLDLSTLGGALGNDTTYHVFRYLKDDDTMQWHRDTSTTPTIADKKSALAYRRILSLKTDASGDLPDFKGNIVDEVLEINYDGFQDYSSATFTTSFTQVTLEFIPSGVKVKPDLGVHSTAAVGTNSVQNFEIKGTGKIWAIAIVARATTAFPQAFSPNCFTDDGTVSYKASTTSTGLSSLLFQNNGFTDYRNQY